MKALTLVDKKKFEIIEKDIPKAEGNKVVIKVKNTGICGSDIHMIWQTGYNAGTKTVTIVAAQEEDVPVIIDGEASVEVGKDITLTSNAENTVWESSNNDIATVNNGVVHGVSKGEVTITATAEGYTPGTKVINVTVVSE